MTEVRFRRVEINDYASTRKLVDNAFRAVGAEDVVSFLDALRNAGCILGEWLAEDATGPTGHIAFSRVRLECANGSGLDAAMLTPLAVRPDRQRIGIGTRLMGYALAALESNGESLFFVLGHPTYYPRMGFRPASKEGVESPWQGNPAFMVRGTAVPAGKLVMPSVIADAH